MGCGTSKLKGDTFDGVNSSAYPPVSREKANQSEAFSEASPTEGSQASPTPLAQSQLNPAASSSFSSPSAFTPTSRMEALRKNPNKLSTLRQQWKERRGVPEPRNPVTGRGLHTGLTPDELKKLVESTRAAGSSGFATGAFGGGNLEMRYIANEPAREDRVRPEELEALKNWQS